MTYKNYARRRDPEWSRRLDILTGAHALVKFLVLSF